MNAELSDYERVNARLIARQKEIYAEDARKTDSPWEWWQVYTSYYVGWSTCINPPRFDSDNRYRRSPTAGKVKIHVPDLGWLWFTPEAVKEAKKFTEQLSNDKLYMIDMVTQAEIARKVVVPLSLPMD